MQNNLEKNVENYFVDVLKMLYLCIVILRQVALNLHVI